MSEANQPGGEFDPSTPREPRPGWRRRRLLFVLLTLVVSILVDQALKKVAESMLLHRPPISLLGDMIRLEYTENPGAFLSLGAGLSPTARFVFLTVLVGAVLVGSLFYLLTTPSLGRGALIGLSLLTGGGIGNLIDRVINRGHVIDYISMGIGPLRTGIFNFADLCITTGTCVLVFSAMRPRHHATTDPHDSRANEETPASIDEPPRPANP
ncbi:MAG: signal peptidase II [Candidatus Eisenbacteria bacterium]